MYTLESREPFPNCGVENGQAIQAQMVTFKPSNRFSGFGVKRGQPVEEQPFSLEIHQRLSCVGIEGGQALESKVVLKSSKSGRCIGVDFRQATER